MSRALLCVVVSLMLAFAPAPLPRRERDGGDDLRKLQGDWERIEHNGQREAHPTPVTVRGDRMQYPSPDDLWTVVLDQKARPKRIDFVKVNQTTNVFRGVYRLEGDTLTYSVRQNVSEQDRPLDFDAKRMGAWVSTYRRKR